MSKRGYNDEQLKTLLIQLDNYIKQIDVFSESLPEGREGWQALLDNNTCTGLAAMALLLHDIAPAGSSIESIFSLMGQFNTKQRATLSGEVMHKMTTIKLFHLSKQ